MKTRCLIVDDEQLARTLLTGYIGKLPHLELVAACRGPMEAMEVLAGQQVDLMFLDIRMPDLMGTDLLRALPQRPLVIFTTAYQEYALEGYALDIVDYLLKPISFERFLQGVQRALAQLSLQRAAQAGGTPAKAPATPERDFITVNADHKIHKLMHSEIRCIEGLREYVRFHLEDRRLLSLQSLKQLEVLLPAVDFIRVHKSWIVNRQHVQAVSGNQIDLPSLQVPIGRAFRDDVMARIFD